jgi:hypothetical protein
MLAIGQDCERWGVQVRWMPGWDTRGATWARVPVGILDHHDASSIKSGEWGSLGYILDGSPISPLSQFQVARCLDAVPKLAIIAAGRCNHAGVGGPYRHPDGLAVPADVGNAYYYGAEKANNGLGEAMNDAFHYATDALFRAVLERCG